MTNKRAIGTFYEDATVRFLEADGFQLISKNYYTPFGEIDLIMSFNQMIYFIEVKYRSSNAFGSPRESINPRKIKHMKSSAIFYIKENHSGFQPYKLSFMGITRVNETLNYDFIENIFS